MAWKQYGPLSVVRFIRNSQVSLISLSSSHICSRPFDPPTFYGNSQLSIDQCAAPQLEPLNSRVNSTADVNKTERLINHRHRVARILSAGVHARQTCRCLYFDMPSRVARSSSFSTLHTSTPLEDGRLMTFSLIKVCKDLHKVSSLMFK